MTKPPVILWFRRDLRLGDNPALQAAIESGQPVIPLYILDETPGLRALGGAGAWWLNRSLSSLEKDLHLRNSRLLYRKGVAGDIIAELIAETGATAVFWNRLYDPGLVERDKALKLRLKTRGLAAYSFNASLLIEPFAIKPKTGDYFKVFTPFWRAVLEKGLNCHPPFLGMGEARTTGAILITPEIWPRTDRLKDWKLHPENPDWSSGFRVWTPGEAGAQLRLQQFLDEGLELYADQRDRPDMLAVSRLSPHLHFGEISPHQIWQALDRTLALKGDASPRLAASVTKFRSELGWREFSHHLLFHRPDLESRNFRADFENFPWREDLVAFKAWRHGQTGYPLIDAAMRQLWQTGYMHNRVRMVVASFLVKHLLIDWRLGEAYFWDTLVDADRANNAASWQWVAGCGADAAPYFRIFNPISQGMKFDPNGDYVRLFVPELANLPPPQGQLPNIHAPWQCDPDILKAAGVSLGKTYPFPIIEHFFARDRALKAFEAIKSLRS